jgi:hypothetical protein
MTNYSDPFAISKTRKINRAWGIITVSGVSLVILNRTYRWYMNKYYPEPPVSNERDWHPGMFEGESAVKRKSPYEGAGNSHQVSRRDVEWYLFYN